MGFVLFLVFFASSGLKFAVKTLFRREYRPDNYVYFSYKALQHEGGDQENIQIQAPFEASSKRGGKCKGNVLVRKRDYQYIFFTIMFFQNCLFFCFLLINFSGRKLDSDTDATGDEASFKVTMVDSSFLLCRSNKTSYNGGGIIKHLKVTSQISCVKLACV